MRTFLAMLAIASIAGLGTAAAGVAAPAKTAKLTPAETKWATPVVELWNTLNTGLLNVVAQATAKEALIIGTKNNGKLNGTLAAFITCNTTLKKAGKAPPRLARFARSMKKACIPLEAGSHDFAKAIGAIRKGNSTLAQKRLIQGVGEFKKASPPLAAARKQLLAAGGKGVIT